MVNRSLKSPDARLHLNPYIRDMMFAKAEQLVQLCKQHRVLSLELFGSVTNDRFNPSTSDLVFLVEFMNQNPDGASARFFEAGLKAWSFMPSFWRLTWLHLYTVP